MLKIKSQNIETISSFLRVPQDNIVKEIEDLRKRHLVLMSPLRKERRLEKFYEILPEGIELINKVQSEGFQTRSGIKQPQVEIFTIIEQTIEEVKNLEEIPNNTKEIIVSNLLKIKEKLEI